MARPRTPRPARRSEAPVPDSGDDDGDADDDASDVANDAADDTGDDSVDAVVIALRPRRLTPSTGDDTRTADGPSEEDSSHAPSARARSRSGRTVPGVNESSTIERDAAPAVDASDSTRPQSARAQSRHVPTVPGVNHTTSNRTGSNGNSGAALDNKFRSDAQHRGYNGIGGSLGDLLHNPSKVAARHQLTLVEAAAPATPCQFPCGVEARVVDDDGRLRPQFAAGQVCDLLGWQSGVLATTLINGWLVLTQRPEHVGARRGRNNDKAGFTVGSSGVERICLRPAHMLHLDTNAGGLLLLAAIPDEGAVVIVNPLLIAAQAPGHVRPLLGAEPARHLAVVGEDVDVFIKEAR